MLGSLAHGNSNSNVGHWSNCSKESVLQDASKDTLGRGNALVGILHKHRTDAKIQVLLRARYEHRLLAAVQRQLVWAQARPEQRSDDAGQVCDLCREACEVQGTAAAQVKRVRHRLCLCADISVVNEIRSQ